MLFRRQRHCSIAWVCDLTTECLAGHVCGRCNDCFLIYCRYHVTYSTNSIDFASTSTVPTYWESNPLATLWIVLSGVEEKGRRQRPALRDEMLSSTGCHTKPLGAELGTHSLTLPEEIGPKQKRPASPFGPSALLGSSLRNQSLLNARHQWRCPSGTELQLHCIQLLF